MTTGDKILGCVFIVVTIAAGVGLVELIGYVRGRWMTRSR
jgi:hypothetical protein